jgi:hypothetical protein
MFILFLSIIYAVLIFSLVFIGSCGSENPALDVKNPVEIGATPGRI